MDKKIICVVGESASGKTRITDAVVENTGAIELHSYTTRAKRNEKDLKTFVNQAEFDAVRDDLVAYTHFDHHEYGATRQQVEASDLYVIDPAGVQMLQEHIGREHMLVVYINVSAYTRFCRLEDERGRETAEARYHNDTRKFADFTDYDISLSNEDESDFKRNVALMEFLLEAHLR